MTVFVNTAIASCLFLFLLTFKTLMQAHIAVVLVIQSFPTVQCALQPGFRIYVTVNLGEPTHITAVDGNARNFVFSFAIFFFF